MKKIISGTCLALLVFWGSFTSCSKSTAGEQDNGQDTTVEEPVEVVPISISFPEADFTDPNVIYNQSQPSYVIRDRLKALIDAVPAGDSLFMSYYLLNDQEIIESLQNAYARGVQMNILLDSSGSESIGTNISTYPDLYYISGYSTIVNDINESIDHNKFVVFSSVLTTQGIVKNVVLQTSNNMTKVQCTYFQDAVIMQHEGLYNKYREVWHDMKKYAKGGMENISFNEYDDAQNGIHGYFFPKLKNTSYFGPDPVIDILDSITNPSVTTIRILMYAWSDARSTIADKLADLMDKGARVEVITRSGNGDGLIAKLNAMAANGAYVRYFYENGTVVKAPHSKYMLIEGEWKGKAVSLIATGSENYTNSALKANNETLLTLLNSSLYTSYYANFNTIKKL